MERLVETTAGKVRGRRLDAVDEFLGIPYAAPPVGPLRFRAPQPREPWPGTLDCTAFGPIPPQAAGGPVDPVMSVGSRPQSEDCLSLNVWTPASDDARRPVMLWLYGGGFSAGCSGAPWMHGAALAARGDVVVVSCNYRLGALGFLHLEPFLGPEYAGSGAAGLLDAVAALEWIRDNAASFGGDPDRVTIFGESAGAVAAALVSAMPAARGLFRRVGVQSGGAHTVHTPDAAAAVTGLLLEELGLGPAEAAGLVEAPLEDLLAAQFRTVARAGAGYGDPAHPPMGLPFQPVGDGAALPADVFGAIAAGPPDVELLVGANRDEFNLIGPWVMATEMADDELAARAAGVFGGESAGRRALDVYRAARPGASARELFFALESDRGFRIPATWLAEAHPGPVHAYLLTLEGTGMGTVMGAAHSLDIPFVFDNLDAPGVEAMLGAVTPAGRELAARMSGAWAAFAATGAPSAPGLPDWPVYEPATRQVMALGAAPEVVADPDGAARALYDALR
jgi:para-nitrobenzyl esterase